MAQRQRLDHLCRETGALNDGQQHDLGGKIPVGHRCHAAHEKDMARGQSSPFIRLEPLVNIADDKDVDLLVLRQQGQHIVQKETQTGDVGSMGGANKDHVDAMALALRAMARGQLRQFQPPQMIAVQQISAVHVKVPFCGQGDVWRIDDIAVRAAMAGQIFLQGTRDENASVEAVQGRCFAGGLCSKAPVEYGFSDGGCVGIFS